MYIGELKYSIEIDGSTTNTLSVPTGETIIDVKVNNQNPVDTYYKLLYLKNTNITVKYYESTKDTNDVVTTYNKPNDSITSSNSNIVKLLITNSSTSSQNIAFTMKGGYITNTLNDIVVPSTHNEITPLENSTNTYFCKTNNTLTQGLQYVNGQYTYAYKQGGQKANSGLAWYNISNNGWGVQLTDKASTDAVTSKVCTYINNKPIVSMSYMFGGSKATTLDVSNFDTSKVTYMNGMFSNSQATTLDVSNFDTSNVTDMSNMFDGSKATTLDLSNFDTSNVTDMSSMFHSSQVTTLDVSNFNTSNVTDMDSMFYYSQATTLDLSNFDTSKVTNMKYMFQSSQATTLDVSSFDTSKVTNMTNMFLGSQATTLDVSNFDTSNVTNMISMFSYSKATTLDVSNFDTSKVTNMSYMFYNFTNLKTIYVSNKFNTDKVTDSTNMFSGCTNLVGGAGTKYNSSYVDKKYARIDGGTSNPGYFTDIADKPSEPNSFATDSWKTIINAVKNNNIGKYNVGDTKTINMGTYGTHTLRLANKSTPSECSGTGFSQTACGFVLEFADLITTHPMNDSATNTGGWPATTMRTFVNDSIYNALPSDLRNSIINTTVVSGIGSSDSSGSATCFKSTDKLYLLAPREIYNNYDGTYDTANSLTRTLDYYITQGVTTTNYSGAIKRGENISYNQWWWLRNANSQLNYSFSMVYDDGSFINNFGANQSIGVSPAFRIG
jgi:surface protein